MPSWSSVYLPLLCSCNLKVLLNLTDVQKMQWHSCRVVILSREYSQRHSLQVSRGSSAKSPASDLSAVMVSGLGFPAEPILSSVVLSAWKEKSRAEASHRPCSYFSLKRELTAHESPYTPKCTVILLLVLCFKTFYQEGSWEPRTPKDLNWTAFSEIYLVGIECISQGTYQQIQTQIT